MKIIKNKSVVRIKDGLAWREIESKKIVQNEFGKGFFFVIFIIVRKFKLEQSNGTQTRVICLLGKCANH